MSRVITEGQILRVTPWLGCGSQVGLTSFWYKCTSVTGPITDQDVLDYITTGTPGGLGFPDLYRSGLCGYVDYLGSVGQLYNPTSYPGPLVPFPWITSILGAGQGTVSSMPIPRQTSGLISKFGFLSGRPYRGRNYIPFPCVDDVDPAQGGPDGPNNSYVTWLSQIGDMMLAPNSSITVSASGNSVILLPTICNGISYPSVDQQIAVVRPRGKWATQRRRGDYGTLNFPALP